MSLKVAIVDDRGRNRLITQDKLMRSKGFEVVLMSSDGHEFLTQMKLLSKESHPDIVLMDLEMPGMNGIDAIATASTFYPDIKYVVLTIFDDDERIFKAIKAGACGYLLKDDDAGNLTEQMKQLHESGVGPVSPGIAHKILQIMHREILDQRTHTTVVDKESGFSLTVREKQILQLLIDGLSYREIGEQLHISTNTAKKHVLNVYQKLHVKSRAQALKLAVKQGLM